MTEVKQWVEQEAEKFIQEHPAEFMCTWCEEIKPIAEYAGTAPDAVCKTCRETAK